MQWSEPAGKHLEIREPARRRLGHYRQYVMHMGDAAATRSGETLEMRDAGAGDVNADDAYRSSSSYQTSRKSRLKKTSAPPSDK